METLFIQAIPGGKGNYYYSYDVYWRGQQIVARSFDPECEAARVLAAHGVGGWALVVDLETGNGRLRLNLDALKGLSFQESDRGMKMGKWSRMPLVPKWVH